MYSLFFYGSESFGTLWWSWTHPYSPYLLLSLIPTPVLSCAVLISRSQNKYVSPRQVLPYLHKSLLLQPHPLLSSSMFLPAILGWLHGHLAVGAWDTHISHLIFQASIYRELLWVTPACLLTCIMQAAHAHMSCWAILQVQSRHQSSKKRPKNYSLHAKYLKDIQ